MNSSKPVIKSVIWELGNWSWGLTHSYLVSVLSEDFDFIVESYDAIKKRGKNIETRKCDIVFCQNVTQMFHVPTAFKPYTVSRLGGIMTFMSKQTKSYLRQIEKCGAVIATNKKLYNIAKEVNPNTFLIPNGIDLGAWKPKPLRVWNVKHPVVGFVGNVSTRKKAEYKGYDILMTACARIRFPVKLALFGTSQIPHEHMKTAFYEKIDILALPTAGEGCSNTIMEALACGVPVVTTREAGFHGEMLEDGVNVIFCERNSRSITNALARFRRDPDLFPTLSRNGRLFAEKYHDINKIAAQYREVFNKILESKKE